MNSEWTSRLSGLSGKLTQTFASKSETLESVAGIHDEMLSILPPLFPGWLGIGAECLPRDWLWKLRRRLHPGRNEQKPLIEAWWSDAKAKDAQGNQKAL